MAQRVVDLSLLIEDNMPAHKLFQRPVTTTHLSHESSKAFNLGVPGDPMTFQTNFMARKPLRSSGAFIAASPSIPLENAKLPLGKAESACCRIVSKSFKAGSRRPRRATR